MITKQSNTVLFGKQIQDGLQIMDAIKEALKEIIKDVFLESINPEEEIVFSERFGADLYDEYEIVVAFENYFGIEIPDDDIHYLGSTHSAVEYLSRRLEEMKEWIAQRE
jgi:acyl carrier protein